MSALKQDNEHKSREFAGTREKDIHSQAPPESNRTVEATDLLGRMHSTKRTMAASEAGDFLKSHKVAHVGTVDAKGWPYVVPLVYIYEGGDILFLHTGGHHGHFLSNIQHDPRVCVEVGEIGPLHGGRPYACNSALVYSSVIVFGAVRIIDDRAMKAWFFERLLAKYGQSDWTFEPGYPFIDQIILYEQQMEIVTGKHGEGLYH